MVSCEGFLTAPQGREQTRLGASVLTPLSQPSMARWCVVSEFPRLEETCSQWSLE